MSLTQGVPDWQRRGNGATSVGHRVRPQDLGQQQCAVKQKQIVHNTLRQCTNECFSVRHWPAVSAVDVALPGGAALCFHLIDGEL